MAKGIKVDPKDAKKLQKVADGCFDLLCDIVAKCSKIMESKKPDVNAFVKEVARENGAKFVLNHGKGCVLDCIDGAAKFLTPEACLSVSDALFDAYLFYVAALGDAGAHGSKRKAIVRFLANLCTDKRTGAGPGRERKLAVLRTLFWNVRLTSYKQSRRDDGRWPLFAEVMAYMDKKTYKEKANEWRCVHDYTSGCAWRIEEGYWKKEWKKTDGCGEGFDPKLSAAIEKDDPKRFMCAFDALQQKITPNLIRTLGYRKARKCFSALHERFPNSVPVRCEGYLLLNNCIDSHDMSAEIMALEKEFPGLVRETKDTLGCSALWYLVYKPSRYICHRKDADRLAKFLVKAGCNPDDPTRLGLSYSELVDKKFRVAVTFE